MLKFAVALAFVVIVLTACATTTPATLPATTDSAAPPSANGELMNVTKERVTLTTTDDVTIVGTYTDGSSSKAVILLHQLNHDKSSWNLFSEVLNARGYAVLAIDLRGHGESQGSWQSFTDKGFQAMTKDVDAAAAFLNQRGQPVVAVLGASIGANTALRYASDHKTLVVLFSPGLSYHGIDVNNVTTPAPVLTIVADGDSYSLDSSREIDANNLFGKHELLVVPGRAHGTYLLDDENVRAKILKFLDENAR